MPGANGIAKTMMSERHKHTEFLKHCLRYDGNSDRLGLHDKLSRIQHEMLVVKRAVWLLTIIILLAVVGLICSETVFKSFLSNSQQLVENLLYALIAGALISIVAFMGLWILFRGKLHRRREESRQFLTRLLAARLGNASPPPAPPANPQNPRLPRG
ncbi:MAG: hypothetical protein P4N60_03505 [Verrucomicrobiae bacterium]|nr:hypothetical protein [Verrucomicrobiae bacterium]